MNTRINKLKELAMRPNGVAGIAGPYMEMDVDLFAELIVRDCASICEINGSGYKYSFTPAKARLAESTSDYCGLLIKKYFGVE